ncbi:MAG: alpha-L-fucosidase, partial [Chitinivibrionales bacterium]|nr:alpha-L-fucosidase [Chitinivibrionales bacterium]
MQTNTRYLLAPMPDAQSQDKNNNLPKPNKMQLAFQELELGLFIHYGLRTYPNGSGPGQGFYSPQEFNPTALDCDNWMETAQAMGAKFVVFTARHEEGFCLWPTRTTDYSLKSSPYKNGKGDVVLEFVEACRRHGLKPCLYHPSYMDAHHTFKPGDPATWHKEWFATTRKRLAEPGAAQRFTALQRAQMHELLTDYGPITYLWLDHITETQGILDPAAVDAFWGEIAAEARACQPDCLLMKNDLYLSRDRDVKGGVHGGRAAYPLWHACRREDTDEGQQDPIADPAHGDQYLVWESNTIFSGRWFWSDDYVKPVDDMMEHYYATIGRGSTFLPNFAPAPDGRMTDKVLKYAREFGDRIKGIYAYPLAAVENCGETAELRLGADGFTQVEIMEDLRRGQKIGAFTI